MIPPRLRIPLCALALLGINIYICHSMFRAAPTVQTGSIEVLFMSFARWLAENWNQQGTPPELPAEVVQQTAAKYAELLERLWRECAAAQ